MSDYRAIRQSSCRITPRSHRAATLRRSSRSSTIWKRLGSGRIGADRRLNRAIWQIVVFITTLLRCHYVKHAADTLLLRCYADRCRPEAAFTAFTLRCRYDIQDPTTTLRRPRWLYDDIATVVPIILRLYYVSSTILAMMYICLRLETYCSHISKLQTWTDVLILGLRCIFSCKCNKMWKVRSLNCKWSSKTNCCLIGRSMIGVTSA